MSEQQLKAQTSHSALDADAREIRLLSLAPGESDDDLIITLQTASLKDGWAAYVALSYAWGTETSPNKVLVNGHRMFIPENLDSGLRHLRQSNFFYTIWIDAFCINQSDLKERSSHVQLMGEIYSLASDVLVWLGPEKSDDSEALYWIPSGKAPPDLISFQHIGCLCSSFCERSWF